jgi:glycosyltransferase involved in cell wall biosynthesis
MRVTWVNRSFLDYRVPVFAELDRLLHGNLTVIYSAHHTPDRVQRKISAMLGSRAIALGGEKVIMRKGDTAGDFANAYVEVSYQPGLYSQIRHANPDVLIGEGFFRWTPAAVAYRLIHKTPLVISYERTKHTERHSQWFRVLYRKTVTRIADAICCNGILSAEYSHWLGMPIEKIVTGAMAADTETLQRHCATIGEKDRELLRNELKLKSPIFLYVGQLVERKGVKQLLEGWQLMGNRRKSSTGTLLIVGDGPERAALEKFSRLSSLKNVLFAGPADYDSIARYYAMADVFVMPTLEDNWSLVVPEAMACGLPILCSKYNGCWPELVKNGSNGFVFDPRDIAEIAKYLGYFLEHPESYMAMGQNSVMIASEYSPKHAANAFLTACVLANDQRK